MGNDVVDKRNGASYECHSQRHTAGDGLASDQDGGRRLRADDLEDSEQRIARPRQVQTGHAARDFVPMEKRSVPASQATR
jgi:hypothetical protein